MRKGLCLFLFVLLFCGICLGQNDPFKIGGRIVNPDGSVIYATDVSILHMGAAGEVNMSIEYRVMQPQWVVLITIPYQTIDIPKNGTLNLYLRDGGHIALPVEREMKWERDAISMKVGDDIISLMRIPYLVTEEQLVTLSEAGIVTRVNIIGSDRTISFDQNVFSSIVSRGKDEIHSMRGFGVPLPSDFGGSD